MNEKKLYLLDALALIYRAYYALIRNPRLTSTGKNTNAQFGFTNTLIELLNKEKPVILRFALIPMRLLNDIPILRATKPIEKRLQKI
jgi:5'-3' exonuclease